MYKVVKYRFYFLLPIIPFTHCMCWVQCLASVAAMQRPGRYHGRATNYAVQSREERCFAGEAAPAGAPPDGGAGPQPDGAPRPGASADEGGDMARRYVNGV